MTVLKRRLIPSQISPVARFPLASTLINGLLATCMSPLAWLQIQTHSADLMALPSNVQLSLDKSVPLPFFFPYPVFLNNAALQVEEKCCSYITHIISRYRMRAWSRHRSLFLQTFCPYISAILDLSI